MPRTTVGVVVVSLHICGGPEDTEWEMMYPTARTFVPLADHLRVASHGHGVRVYAMIRSMNDSEKLNLVWLKDISVGLMRSGNDAVKRLRRLTMYKPGIPISYTDGKRAQRMRHLMEGNDEL